MKSGVEPSSIRRGAKLLAIFVVVSIVAIACVQALTHERIEASRAQLVASQLAQVLPPEFARQPDALDPIHLQADAFGSPEPQLIHRFRDANASVAVLNVVAPDGYNGPIHLLVGLDDEGRLSGVRVSEHAETPGLGDDLELGRSNWILQFNNIDQNQMQTADWQVARQGGKFDGMTGATITSSAVIGAVHRAARWYQNHRGLVFNEQ